ncbi:MAG: hypothetical protein M8353_06505 [ANME-2 cluster archaeon]|nr:hypothetical protein [ANME-2 cluster archaeon]
MNTVCNQKRVAVPDLILSHVSGEIPGMKMEKLSGTFLTKVFEGPYKSIGKWTKEMESYVRTKGKELKKMYFFYTTCPKCAEFYGKNYVVILAEV